MKIASWIVGISLFASPAFGSLWSIDERFELQGQRALVTDTVYTPDGAMVLSCDAKGSVFAWNPQTGAPLWNLAEPEGNFSRLAVSHDGQLAAVVGLHFAGLIDVNAGAWLQKFTLPNGGSLSAVALSDSNLIMAVGGSDSHIRLIDLVSGTMTAFATHDWGILDLRFTDQDQFLLAGDATSVRIWTVETQGERRIIDVEAGDLPGTFFLSHMAFSENGNYVIVSAGNDAMLFDLSAQQLVQHFKGHDKEVIVVRITPDLASVITSSRDHTTRIWDVETGAETGMSSAIDLSLTAAIGVSPKNDQFIMSAALFDIFGGTVRTKLGIWGMSLAH